MLKYTQKMPFFYKIKNINDKLFDGFWKIYKESFPVYEQRSWEQQIKAFNNKHYNLYCLTDKDMLTFFVCFWEFDEYVYIEHLAVNPTLRGKNIGSCSLIRFKEEIKKRIILEIDPVIDETSEKRFHFYRKLDFRLNPYKHFHPAYNPDYQPHELQVLSTDKALTEEEYTIFKKDLEEIVMK